MAELRAGDPASVQDKRSTTARVEADLVAAAAASESAGGDASPASCPPKTSDPRTLSRTPPASPAVVDGIERSVAGPAPAAPSPGRCCCSLVGDAEVEASTANSRVALLDRATVDTAVRGLPTRPVTAGGLPRIARRRHRLFAEVGDQFDRELGKVELGAACRSGCCWSGCCTGCCCFARRRPCLVPPSGAPPTT